MVWEGLHGQVLTDTCCCCCRVDPFDANSPLKKMAVESFNSDMFFVLRVIQLLRCDSGCSSQHELN